MKADELLTDPNPNGDNLREDHSDNKNWITKWYGPDGNYENNGGFQASSRRDLIDEGTGWETHGTQTFDERRLEPYKNRWHEMERRGTAALGSGRSLSSIRQTGTT